MADKINFFDEPMEDQEQEIQDIPEKIKLGSDEYTQDELQKLVGLGKIGQELEEKWKTKIDRVYPDYTRSRQEVEMLKKQIEEQTQAKLQDRASQGMQLTPDEVRQQALKAAEELGIGPQAIRNIIREETQAREMIGSINSLLNTAQADGNPITTPEKLLDHMRETGIRSPQKAYKDMFEDELDAIKEKKLQGLRQPGLVTTTQSTAGAKQPSQVKVTKQNLHAMVAEYLGGTGE